MSSMNCTGEESLKGGRVARAALGNIWRRPEDSFGKRSRCVVPSCGGRSPTTISAWMNAHNHLRLGNAFDIYEAQSLQSPCRHDHTQATVQHNWSCFCLGLLNKSSETGEFVAPPIPLRRSQGMQTRARKRPKGKPGRGTPLHMQAHACTRSMRKGTRTRAHWQMHDYTHTHTGQHTHTGKPRRHLVEASSIFSKFNIFQHRPNNARIRPNFGHQGAKLGQIHAISAHVRSTSDNIGQH